MVPPSCTFELTGHSPSFSVAVNWIQEQKRNKRCERVIETREEDGIQNPNAKQHKEKNKKSTYRMMGHGASASAYPGRFDFTTTTHKQKMETLSFRALSTDEVSTICANRYIAYLTECLGEFSRKSRATEVCFLNAWTKSTKAYMENRLFLAVVRRKVLDLLYDRGYDIVQWIPTNVDGVFNLRLSWSEPQNIGF